VTQFDFSQRRSGAKNSLRKDMRCALFPHMREETYFQTRTQSKNEIRCPQPISQENNSCFYLHYSGFFVNWIQDLNGKKVIKDASEASSIYHFFPLIFTRPWPDSLLTFA
jgi:hypothetical protein